MRLRKDKVKEVKVGIILIENKKIIKLSMKLPVTHFIMHLVLVIIDHFLSNTTRLNILPVHSILL